MLITAIEIRCGDRIVAFCNQKRQTCIVRKVMDSAPGTITLKVFTSGHFRESGSRVIRFRHDALVDVVG
uniref:FeoA family protein n=1 Tax=Cyanothece sp. (strain PCC 7425 / ATCC 29141) TaxID=395961 RepID=B8HKK0_CYAP4